MSICKVKGREDKCNLKVIATYHQPISEQVVRWCSHCGAVVIDEDYDGRTNPGSVRPMEFPTLAKKNED